MWSKTAALKDKYSKGLIVRTKFAFFAAAGPLLTCTALVFTSASPAQSVNGASLYKNRCAACHASSAGAIGPNLTGVVGRKAGAGKYNYSKAMKASKLVWTKSNLDKFLAAPTKTMPGTKMVVGVADAKQRAAIIEHLVSMK